MNGIAVRNVCVSMMDFVRAVCCLSFLCFQLCMSAELAVSRGLLGWHSVSPLNTLPFHNPTILIHKFQGSYGPSLGNPAKPRLYPRRY